MKKFFYLTAIAALSFAACTKEIQTLDEAVPEQNDAFLRKRFFGLAVQFRKSGS